MTKPIEKILGFDFGLKRIGVAFGQTITHQASPVATISATGGEPDWIAIDKLIQTWRPDALIIGRPTHQDGHAHAITNATDVFASDCQNRYDLPVFRIDEHLSSAQAKQYLIETVNTKKTIKSQIDAFSAKVICERWLEEYKP